MKNLIGKIILLIGMFMIMQTTVFADTSVNVNNSQMDDNFQSVDTIENLLKKQSDIKKNELDTIKSNLNTEIKNEGKQAESLDSEDENEIKSYDINEIKKEYVIDSTIISDYKKTKSFKKLISENSQLYVPINTTNGNEGYAIINPENQEVIGWCSNVEGTDGFYHNTEEIVKIIYNAFSESDEKIQDIRFINTTRYDSHLVYIEMNSGSEYIIPYFTDIAEYPFENSRVYEAGDFIDQLNDVIDEDSMLNEETFGGISFKKDNSNVSRPLCFILVGSIICIGCFLYLLKKSRMKNK